MTVPPRQNQPCRFRSNWTFQALSGSAVLMAGLLAQQNAPAVAEETPEPVVALQSPSASDLAFYEKDVRPILEQHCNKCHGAGKARGGLAIVSTDALLKGGDSGPALDLAAREKSLFVDVINYGSYEMPPDGKLPAGKIATLTDWIKRGAPMPVPTLEQMAATPHEGPPQVNEANRKHWAFQPVREPQVPNVQQKDKVRNPIDAFVLSKLEAADMEPVAPADRATLIRRAYYDLTGLPPTLAEVDAFVNDQSPEAWDKVITKLLDSPHYGEKWGRFWLDLVRYGETNSFERDNPKPNVWKYRDYVIRAFNTDKPYNEFLREQIAGDEFEQATPESIIATGYYRLGIWDDEPADDRQAFYDEMDDILSTTGQVMLGMTVGCARCHDHKLDPMPTKDYYSLLAFLGDVRSYANRGDQMNSPNSQTDISPAEIAAAHRVRDERLAKLQAEFEEIERETIPRFPGVDQRKTEGREREKTLKRLMPQYLKPGLLASYVALKDEYESLKKEPLPAREMALSVNNCLASPRVQHILVRGNPGAEGEIVEPAFLSIIDDGKPVIPERRTGAKSSGRRLVLADWIASKDNPLTHRTMVNRIWQMHFGRGICPSTNNLGMKGDPPTHPELLDWLTVQFIENGFHMKPIHRLILKSYAWQMDATPTEKQAGRDPQNELYGHFDMRRLQAEEVRDTILAVTGELNLTVGGPSIYIEMPKEVLAGQSVPGQGWGHSTREEQNRRSVYIHLKRSLLPPVLSNLDFPDPDVSCPARFATTQPTQALTSLNSLFYNEEARRFAAHIQESRKPVNDREFVAAAVELCLARRPTEADLARGEKLLMDLREKDSVEPQKARDYFCLVMLNLNEFFFLD